MFEHFQEFKNEVKKAAEDAAMKNQRDVTGMEAIETMNSDGKNLRDKAFAVLQFIRGKIPGLEDVYKEFIYDTGHLPFNLEELSFEGKIGAGVPSVVYLLESKDPQKPSWVLKVLQKQGDDVEALLKRAKTERSEYTEIKDWYKDIPEVIPTEDMLIMENPRDAESPALVIVQKFIGSELKNFFSIPEQELTDELNADVDLKREVQAFARITIDKYRETGQIIDIMGYKNLVISQEGGKERLRFIDPHWIHSAENMKEGDILWVEKCLAVLERLNSL